MVLLTRQPPAPHQLSAALADAEDADPAAVELLRSRYLAAGCRFNEPEVLAVESRIVDTVLEHLAANPGVGTLDEFARDTAVRDIRYALRSPIYRESPRRAAVLGARLEERIREAVDEVHGVFRDTHCDCWGYSCECREPGELPEGVEVRDIAAAVDRALRGVLGAAATYSTDGVVGAADHHVLAPFEENLDEIIWVQVKPAALTRKGRNVAKLWKSLDQFDRSRSQRGRGLARSSVGNLTLTSRGATARVAGSDPTPYRVQCQWLVGVAIPADPTKIKARCTCPDGERWCKHAAAVLYVLAAALDDNPAAFSAAIDGSPPWVPARLRHSA